ncbi:MAG: alpha/beta hydrolase [Cyclobacteriaceae bacterium]|nr:alpha/beta hydrolase [Cyclobacteriaceae bacterium]
MKYLLPFILIISSFSQKENPRYLFYLHGQIVENQGADAHSEQFGNYEYNNIVNVFKKEDFNVISEVRPEKTVPMDYAEKVANQVKELIKSGVNPENITVVGASKGSLISMLVSTKLQNPDVNFVLLAACNDWNREHNDIKLCGRILSIYEETDTIGKSCVKIFSDADCELITKEIKLNTGLKHGMIFRPLPEWVQPTVDWARLK